MRRLISTAALALLSILALAGAVGAAEQVPFNGTLQGSFTVSADPPPAINRILDAEGHATQLGDFTFHFPHSVDRSVVPATGIGFAVFTAANGHEVFAFITGEATLAMPGVLQGIEFGVIIGGTGRFANATGEFVIERLIDTIGLTTVGEFEGTISSPAAARK
jgi:hypothetical protein